MSNVTLETIIYGPFTQTQLDSLWHRATGTLAVRINGVWTTLENPPRTWPIESIEAVYGTTKSMSNAERIATARLLEASEAPRGSLQRVADAECLKQAKDEVIAAVHGTSIFTRKVRNLLRTAGLVLVAFLVAHAALFAAGTLVMHGSQWVWLINKHLVALFPDTPDLTTGKAAPMKPEAP